MERRWGYWRKEEATGAFEGVVERGNQQAKVKKVKEN